MFLNLDAPDCKLKLVYELATELEKDPELMRSVQALTLNPEKPLWGLKGAHGLYGSPEWWDNVRAAFAGDLASSPHSEQAPMRATIVSGIIDETYFAGMDARWGDEVNSFRLKLDDGTVWNESIYPKLKSYRKWFRPGARVLIAYVHDEYKARDANGQPKYSETVVEMAVSTKPLAG